MWTERKLSINVKEMKGKRFYFRVDQGVMLMNTNYNHFDYIYNAYV